MKFILTISAAIIFLNVEGQLEKGTWLAGGTGSLFSYNSTLTASTYYVENKYTQIRLSAPAGYFIKDKLAIGLKPALTSTKAKPISPGSGSTNIQRYWIGPYCRYYFLEKEKASNIITDISWQTGFYNAGGEHGKLRAFSAMTGLVVFFNTSIGIELLFGYNYTKEDVEQATKVINKGILLSAGFQIHLKK